MPRRRTHRFAIQTKGLTDEEAARLFYMLMSAPEAFTDDSTGATSVPLAVLRGIFPDTEWEGSTTQDRLDLVK